MKRVLSVSISLLILCAAAALAWIPVRSAPDHERGAAVPAPLLQSDKQSGMPVDGWSVCQIGGLETIPGSPISARWSSCATVAVGRSKLTASRWGCLSRRWAGHARRWAGIHTGAAISVQELQLLTVLQAPAATVTPSPTVIPSLTSTPGSTVTPAGERISPTPSATIYSRPHPGGPGNAGILLAGAAGLAGLAPPLRPGCGCGWTTDPPGEGMKLVRASSQATQLTLSWPC